MASHKLRINPKLVPVASRSRRFPIDEQRAVSSLVANGHLRSRKDLNTVIKFAEQADWNGQGGGKKWQKQAFLPPFILISPTWYRRPFLCSVRLLPPLFLLFPHSFLLDPFSPRSSHSGNIVVSLADVILRFKSHRPVDVQLFIVNSVSFALISAQWLKWILQV